MSGKHRWPEDAPQWWRWAVFVGPLAAYFAIGAVIPGIWQKIYIAYEPSQSPSLTLSVAVLRLVLIAILIFWLFNRILSVFPLRVSAESIGFGLVGAAVWIGLCRLNLEGRLLELVGVSKDWLGTRDAVDPWSLFFESHTRHAFLVTRFALLVIVVPIAEELFLRGFLIRSIESERWETLPVSAVGARGLTAATIYGILTHPSECIAAAFWFSMITVMMIRTRNFWDCVIAHSITNLVLGIYIVSTGDWRLW